MHRSLWLTPLLLVACLESGPVSHELSTGTGVTREQPSTSPVATGQPGAATLARSLLATLPVRPQGPHTGYARDQFGPPWADADRNGCDTRNDILRRDLVAPQFRPATRDCVVVSGTLADPYTGTRIDFDRGGGSQIDIDHVVALGNAWATGAAQWSHFRKCVALANDPLNLLAVEAAANRAKSDSDAASWLPPDPAYHCAYVARQIAVKAKYALSITAAEHDAMTTVLARCPEQRAPVGDAPTLAPIDPPEPKPHAPKHSEPRTTAPKAIEPRAPAAAKTTTKPTGTAPNYGTCKAAKANRAGPYVRGRDPEYAFYNDRDGDGVVCE